MVRTALGLGVMAVLLAAAGCTMCCHPYDYCGPVYEGDGCQSCSLHSRAGSILASAPEITPSPDMVRRPVRNQTASDVSRGRVQTQSVSDASLRSQVQAERRAGDVPGSEQIVSVTDRVVGSSPDSDGDSQLASESSAEPARPLSTKGWTARRPTPEITR